MPQYKVHIAGAALLFVASVFLLSLQHSSVSVLLECLLCTLLGGLFPDIDIKSKGQKIFYYLFGAVSIWLLLTGALYTVALLSILALFPILARHRGIFHNFCFVGLLVGAVVVFLSAAYPPYKFFFIRDGAFFLLGVFSHLVLDRGIGKTLRWR